jgi:hypothetical protein
MHAKCPEVYQRVILDWLNSGRSKGYFVLHHAAPYAQAEDRTDQRNF